MAIPPGSTRIVFSGDLPGGEIWSSGFWMTSTGVHDNNTANAQAFIITATLNSADPSGGMRIAATKLWNAGIRWLKTNAYHYVTGAPTADFVGEYVLPTPRAGTVNSGMPNQICAVLSLRTGLSGRSHRGRMYLPAGGAALQLDGQLVQADATAVANAWALAFTDINASDAGKVVVVSQRLTAFTVIESVRMDSRLDVQRSRAKSQVIDSVSAAAVTP